MGKLRVNKPAEIYHTKIFLSHSVIDSCARILKKRYEMNPSFVGPEVQDILKIFFLPLLLVAEPELVLDTE